MKRPGTEASLQWKWTKKIYLIFGDDPAIELKHFAEVGDGGSIRKRLPAAQIRLI
jgi:hypothetical protein